MRRSRRASSSRASACNEAELVAWLGVSRTPIREALTRLERSGLVETTPGRLTRVSPLQRHRGRRRPDRGRRDARGGDPRSSAADDRRGPGRDDRRPTSVSPRPSTHEDVDAAIAADDAFHHVAVAVCGNAALAAVLAQFSPTLRRIERLRFGSLAARGSVEQHDDIIRLCTQGAAVEAAVATRSNWQTLRPSITDLEPDPKDTSR